MLLAPGLVKSGPAQVEKRLLAAREAVEMLVAMRAAGPLLLVAEEWLLAGLGA